MTQEVASPCAVVNRTEEFSRPVWSSPRLEIGYVSEQTQGVGGLNFDANFDPQS